MDVIIEKWGVYDSKTGWAPIRCVIWRSLRILKPPLKIRQIAVLPGNHENYGCNLCGHLQRCQMPDIENSRKNSRKRCRVGPGQGADENSRKTAGTTAETVKTAFFGVFCSSGCFSAVCRDPLGTFFGCFPAVGHLALL